MTRRHYFQMITFAALVPMFVGLPVLWTVGYLAVLFACMVLVIPLFICRHCPHWDNNRSFLTCDAHCGIPKLYSAVDAPLNRLQRFCVHAGFVVIFGVPVVLLAVYQQYALAVCSAANGVWWYITLRKVFCTDCLNNRCPLQGGTS
jgi:hypothetical protein